MTTGQISCLLLTAWLFCPSEIAIQIGRAEDARPGTARSAEIPWKDEQADAWTGTSPELCRSVHWDIRDKTPIELFIAIEAAAGIPVILDRSLVDANIIPPQAIGERFRGSVETDKSARLTNRVADLPLWAALDAFVDDVDGEFELEWCADEGVIQFETRTASQVKRTTRRYDLGPAVAYGVDPSLLLEALPEVVAGPWDRDEPGTATCSLVGNQLIVRAPSGTHRELRAIIKALAIRGADEVLIDQHRPAESLWATLEERFAETSADLSLPEALRAVSRTMPLLFHESSLELLSAEGDLPPVTPSKTDPRRRLTIRQALRVEGDELTIATSGNRLVVMDRQEESNRRHLRLYTLSEAERLGRTPELIGALLEQTSGPWDRDQPGTGTLALVGSGRLLIRQSERMHIQIRDFLREQLAVLEETPGNRDRIETRVYLVRTDIAIPLENLIKQTIDPEIWFQNGVVRGRILSYPIPGNAPSVPRGMGRSDTDAGRISIGLSHSSATVDFPQPPVVLAAPPPRQSAGVSLAGFSGLVDSNAEGRREIRGDGAKECVALVIRAPFRTHRKIDRRIEEMFAAGFRDRIVGLPAQFGVLMEEDEVAKPQPDSKPAK